MTPQEVKKQAQEMLSRPMGIVEDRAVAQAYIEAMKVLEEIEWIPSGDDFGSIVCPSCGADKATDRHDERCKLARVLGRVKESDAPRANES